MERREFAKITKSHENVEEMVDMFCGVAQNSRSLSAQSNFKLKLTAQKNMQKLHVALIIQIPFCLDCGSSLPAHLSLRQLQWPLLLCRTTSRR